MHTYSYFEYVCILLPELTSMISFPTANFE